MPNDFKIAVAKINALLLQIDGARHLSVDELAAYNRDYLDGWQLPNAIPQSNYKIRLFVNGDFPYSAPRIAIYPAPELLAWPHLEENGFLCIWQERVTHNHNSIKEVVKTLLRDAIKLVNKCIAKENTKDFENEFVSYWDRYKKFLPTMASVCKPNGPSRNIAVTYLESGKTVFAEDECALRRWLSHRYGESTAKELNITKSAFIWPNKVWHPREYPKHVADLFKLLGTDTSSSSILSDRLFDGKGKIQSILLGFQTENGVAAVGVRIIKPQKQKGKGDPLTHGFRNILSVPKDVFLARYSTSEVLGVAVSRQDPFWIHGRDHNLQDISKFQSVSVVILGAGSVGSSVATLLARVGIGKITIIDRATLAPENLSRHELGSRQLNKNKAEGLATKLSQDFPHIETKGVPLFWNEAYHKNPEDFLNSDLIISSIGEWQAESMLDDTRKLTENFPPVLFGWTEAYSCIGHAILLLDNAHCLQSVCTPLGLAKLPIANWENGETVKTIPACGGQFQPYGAVELAHIHALISELALEILKGEVKNSMHRTWLGKTKFLEQSGGKWNPAWIEQYGDPGEGGRIVELPLSKAT